MNKEIDTIQQEIQQEIEQIKSTFLPNGDLVEEQRNLIKQLEEKIKETEEKIKICE